MNRFAKNSAFSTITGICTALASFLSTVIVARVLGTEGTGIVIYTLWIVTMAVTFADFGTHATLSRYLPELTSRGDTSGAAQLAAYLFRPYLGATLLVAGAFALMAILGQSQNPLTAANWEKDPLVWLVMGVLFLLQAMANFAMGYLRGMQRFGMTALLTASSLILQLAAVAVGSVLFGFLGALGGYCAASLAPALVSATVARRGAGVDAALRRRVLRFALFAWAGALTLAFVWSRAEVFFLERSWGSESVALFSVGLTFANLAAQGPMLLTGGLLPYFSEGVGRRATGQVHDAFATGTRIIAFLLFPICFGTAAIIPVLLPLVYGPAFASAVPAACIVVAAAAFGGAGAVGSHLIYANERSDFIFFSGAVGTALSIAAGLLVVPQYGVLGAAWARAGIHVFMVAYGCWFIAKRLGCPIPYLALGRLMLAAITCALVAHLCVEISPNAFVGLPLAITAATFVYIAAVRALGALPMTDIARLQSLTRKLPGRLGWPMGRFLNILSTTRA